MAFSSGYALFSFFSTATIQTELPEKKTPYNTIKKVTKKSDTTLFSNSDLQSKIKSYKKINSNDKFRNEIILLFNFLKNGKNKFNIDIALQTLIFNWVMHDPEDALNSIESLFRMDLTDFELEYKYKLIENIFYAWSRINPEQAANYYKDHTSTYNDNELLRFITKGYAEKSPDSAFNWIKSLDNSEIKIALASFFMNLDLENSQKFSKQLPPIKWATDFSDSLFIERLAENMAKHDPDLLSNLLEQTPRLLRSDVIKHQQTAEIKRKNYTKVFLELDKETDIRRTDRLRYIDSTLNFSLSNFDQAKDWLDALNKYDKNLIQTQKNLINTINRKYSDETEQWLKEIPDDEFKNTIMNKK